MTPLSQKQRVDPRYLDAGQYYEHSSQLHHSALTLEIAAYPSSSNISHSVYFVTGR